jgi:dUTPase
MNVKMLLSDKLKEVLEKNGIKKYEPAYDGESACLDLYYTGTTTVITPFEMDRLISTGLRVIIPKGHVGLIQERGSVTKLPVKLRAGVIDVGYHDEIFVNCVVLDQVNSYGNKRIQLSEGMKLPFQLMVIPVCNEYETIDNQEEFFKLCEDSKRKDGKIGSSDGLK